MCCPRLLDPKTRTLTLDTPVDVKQSIASSRRYIYALHLVQDISVLKLAEPQSRAFILYNRSVIPIPLMSLKFSLWLGAIAGAFVDICYPNERHIFVVMLTMWLDFAMLPHGGSIVSLAYKSTIHALSPLRFYQPLIRSSGHLAPFLDLFS